MKNKYFTIFLTTILLFLLLVAPGFSQGSKLSIQIQLRKLDDRLKYAEEIVKSYGGKTAYGYLKQAKEMLDLANKNFETNRPLIVVGYIRQANFYLELAVRTTLSKSGNRMAEQLDEMIKRAEHVAADCSNREAQRLLIQAKKNQENAIQKLKHSKIERGLELMRIAYFLAEKVIKYCGKQQFDPADKVLEEKERFEQLLDRTMQTVEQSNSPKAKNHVSQALNQAEQAEKAYRNRKYDKALDHYYKASRLLWRAIELAKSFTTKNPAQSLRMELDRLNAALSSLQEQAQENEKAEFLYHRAVKLGEEARIALNSGRLRIAHRKIKMAQTAIGRAHGFLGDATPDKENRLNRIENELNRLQNKLEAQRQNPELRKNPQANTLVQIAEQNVNFAQQALKNENRMMALERILTAHQFLVRAEEITQNTQTEALSPDVVRSQLALYDELFALDASHIQEKNNPNANLLLNQAQKYRNQAETALQKNELIVAQSLVEMAHQLVMRSRELSRK